MFNTKVDFSQPLQKGAERVQKRTAAANYVHAVKKGIVKPRPSRRAVDAGNRFTEGMLAMKKTLLAAALLCGVSGAALAQSTPYPLTKVTPTNPSGNATTGFLMAGLGVAGAGGGWTVTPLNTGKVHFIITGAVANDTNSDGAAMSIVYGPTSVVAAPANGAAVPSGSTVCTNTGTNLANDAGGAASIRPFALDCIAKLTPGQAWWADLQTKAVTGGTVTVTSITAIANEVQ